MVEKNEIDEQAELDKIWKRFKDGVLDAGSASAETDSQGVDHILLSGRGWQRKAGDKEWINDSIEDNMVTDINDLA